MRNAGLDEEQAGIKIARRNIKTSDMQTTPPLWQKVKNKEPFDESERRVKKMAENSTLRGSPKMVEEQDRETTFSLTNSLKEHLNSEQIPQNNF